MHRGVLVVAATLGLLSGAAVVWAAEPFALKLGDRVLLLGGGFMEQERRYADLEIRLARRAPGPLTFRNLGWSGDTVNGAARTAGFHNPEGFDRLLKEVREQAPTVILLGRWALSGGTIRPAEAGAV